MTNVKKALFFALALLPIALVAGVLVGIYQIDVYSEEMIAEAVAQLGSTELLVVLVAVQTAGYALFCGFFGYLLADKVGLWRPIRIEKKPLLVTALVSLVGGIILSLDHWTFGSVIDGIRESNAASLTPSGILAAVLYGGIIEEVMLRLFFLSLIAFLLWKIFFRKYGREQIPSVVFVIANVIAALLFAAAHLPATLVLFESLTPLLLFRCFLLNGGFGVLFGLLYRKYGIVYAMAGHVFFHIVAKLTWILFI